jgi:hypothetical protein
LSTFQQRLTDDLHCKIGKALSEENAAIAALDEQLWITDQRLGQRIDEVAQAKVQDCPSSVEQLTRNGLGGGASSSSSSSSPAAAPRHSTKSATDILVTLPEVDERLQVSNTQEQGVEGAMSSMQSPNDATAATSATAAATAAATVAANAADAATTAPANTASVHRTAVHQASSPRSLEHELALHKDDGILGRRGRAFSMFALAGQTLAEAAELGDAQPDPLTAFTLTPPRHSFPIAREPQAHTRLATASSNRHSPLRDLRHSIGGGSAAAALVARAERRELREMQARQRQQSSSELLAKDLTASDTLAVATHAER